MYEKLIHRLEMYANAIRILSKGYLPISLFPQTKLENIQMKLRKPFKLPIWIMILLLKLHLYYDMKLVTIGIHKRNLIVQFPISIQPYIHL